MREFYHKDNILKAPAKVLINNALTFCMSEREKSRVGRAFGFKVHNNAPCGWGILTQDVEEHTDDWGKCLVYLYKGAGRLWINSIPHNLAEGNFTSFNDRVPHSFDVFGDVTLLVCNYSGTIRPELSKSLNFVKVIKR